MPRQASAPADWKARDKAPEYPASAGTKTSTDAHPVTETATEARQGLIEYKVSTVLIVSTLAVIVAFALVYLVFFGRG